MLSRVVQRAIRPFSTAANVFKTPLYDLHVDKKGKMVEFAGYLLPEQYADYGVLKEHMAVRAPESTGIFDVSHMGQLRWYGKNRLEFLESVLCGDVKSLKPGESRLSLVINDQGGIVDDTIVTNAGEYVYQVVNGATKLTDMDYFDDLLATFRRKGKDVFYEYVQDRTLIAIQGKGAHNLLQPFISVDLSTLHFMHSTKAMVRNLNVRVSRCGYTGEDGFELSIPSTDAIPLVKEMFDAGAVPCGLGCRDSLRLEAGLCLYSVDMDSTVDPMTAGLMWTVSKSRQENGGFPGHAKVMEMKTNWTKKRVGLIGTGAPARHGAKICTKDGEEVGYVTSGTMSPCLGKPIAMGYVNRNYHKVGTELMFSVRGKLNPAKVVKTPFVENTYYHG